MSTEPRLVDGEWESPYKRSQIKCTSFPARRSIFPAFDCFTVPTLANVIKEMLASEHRHETRKTSPHSAVTFLRDGMRLQKQQ